MSSAEQITLRPEVVDVSASVSLVSDIFFSHLTITHALNFNLERGSEKHFVFSTT